jgi:predicted ATPase/DNA-binding winged helix-turn-helix (wHTH) protein
MLLESDKPSHIGSRAMEILLALVERAGETVTKQELLARAWSNTMVDEANLRVHITALRKVLGGRQGGTQYIINVMGRGYCFVAPISPAAGSLLPPTPTFQPSAQHNLPTLLTRIVGRADAIEAVALQVPMRRNVVITGPGGIGKTTVAVAAAEKLLAVYDDGVWFIDLAAIVDEERVPFAVAATLGFSIASANPLPSLVEFLRNKRLLLLLDNCEHLVESVAPLVEGILGAAPNVSVLATSREAVRTEGEWVYRLKPMAIPPEANALTAAEALRFAGVQLFIEHASASLDGFQLTDAEAPIVGQICRHLDGLPLAIELAATRIDMFGLRGLQSVLNEHFLQAPGLRTAQPRQQSLAGALEWSYRLLSAVEQTILRRLAIFRSDFTLDAATDVVAGDGVSVAQVYAGMMTLSAKSLISTDVTVDAPQHRHRLLHITRAFADQKLHASGDSDRLFRRHADFLYRLFITAEADWELMERKQWMDAYGHTIDDVRAALDWAFSSDGDPGLGVRLTAAVLPLGFQLSLIDELRGWVERALLHASLIVPHQPLSEMRLNIAMSHLAHNQVVPIGGRMPSLERAIELSMQLDTLACQCEPLIGQSVQYLALADYSTAMDVVRKAREIAQASGDPKAVLGVDRVGAQVYHFYGDHGRAKRLATTVLEHPTTLVYNAAPVDRRVAMREVGADRVPVFGRKTPQPLEHRLRSARRAIENDWYLGQAWRSHPFPRDYMYHR